MTIEALFNSITPGMCKLSPGRFQHVKESVIKFINGRQISNTTKEQLQHTNTSDEYGSVQPYPGSYDAVSGTYYTWVKDTFEITEKKTETGKETTFYPGSFNAITGRYEK